MMRVLPKKEKCAMERVNKAYKKGKKLLLVSLVVLSVVFLLVACNDSAATPVETWNTYANKVMTANKITANAVVTDSGVEVYSLNRVITREGEGATVEQSVTKLGDNFLPATTTTTNVIENVDADSLWTFDFNHVTEKLAISEGALTVELDAAELSRALFIDGSMNLNGNATAVVKGTDGVMQEAIFTFTLTSGRQVVVTFTYGY